MFMLNRSELDTILILPRCITIPDRFELVLRIIEENVFALPVDDDYINILKRLNKT